VSKEDEGRQLLRAFDTHVESANMGQGRALPFHSGASPLAKTATARAATSATAAM
jgi:hypothetical protein